MCIRVHILHVHNYVHKRLNMCVVYTGLSGDKCLHVYSAFIVFLVECGASKCNIQGCSLYEVKWILCDDCSTWLHKYCVGLEENDDPSKFLCEICERNQQTVGRFIDLYKKCF